MATEPSHIFTPGEPALAGQVNTNFREAMDDLRNFTYGETIVVNDALYLRASDGRVLRTSASFNDERIHNFVGFAKEAGVLNNVRKVQVGRNVDGFTNLVVGSNYFLSNNVGAISLISGTITKGVGLAINPTTLLLKEQVNTPLVVGHTPSNILRWSNDTVRSTHIQGTSFILLKETRLNEDLPSTRVSFEMSMDQSVHGNAEVRRNGVIIGTNFGHFGTTWGALTQDLTGFLRNDLIQVFARLNTMGTIFVRNFRFSFDRAIISVNNQTLSPPLAISPTFIEQVPTNIL